MGFRFRKSVNLGPFRLNFSKSGVGASVGVKGFRVTKKAGGGTRTTASIPGTGISYVTETSGKKASAGKRTDSAAPAAQAAPQSAPETESPVNQAARRAGGKKPMGRAPMLVLVVLVIIGAAAACNEVDKASDPLPAEDEPQQVEETLPPEDDAQDAPEAVPEDEAEPEDPEPVQEPAEAPESPSEAQEVQDPAPTTEKPASGPAAPAETVSEPQSEPAPAPVVTPAPEPEPDPAPAQETSRTVYITPTGSKYHYDNNCNGGTYIASTLDEALALNLTPCKKCAGG